MRRSSYAGEMESIPAFHSNSARYLERSNSLSPKRFSAKVAIGGSLSARQESNHNTYVQEAGISLLGLAFDGIPVQSSQQGTYEDEAEFVEGVDPELFLEGVKEHAKYLGMDPNRDAEFLWIARESLVAPVPEGWYQVMTKEGAPYYYNEQTGESRWEHPSDRSYIALFNELKQKKIPMMAYSQYIHEHSHSSMTTQPQAWTEEHGNGNAHGTTGYQIQTDDVDLPDMVDDGFGNAKGPWMGSEEGVVHDGANPTQQECLYGYAENPKGENPTENYSPPLENVIHDKLCQSNAVSANLFIFQVDKSNRIE